MPAQSTVNTSWLGRAREHHAVLGSTNDRAAAWARDGAPHGALVIADAQTSGRGRLGRRWFSPPGASVYASIVLKHPTLETRHAALGLAVGLGLHAGLSTLVDGLALKWPNDVLGGGRKVAGILCESRVQGGAADLVAGFGINVHRVQRPAELEAVAIDLEELGVAGTNCADVLTRVIAALEPVLEVFLAFGFGPLRERYESVCATLGREVELHDAMGGAPRHVTAVGVEDDGALLVRGGAKGVLLRVEAGEVSLR
jgi:BirA family transcriptional regulator, biotin operon repressor / biotin---[acetyl-CoA-carboxylase] ligase